MGFLRWNINSFPRDFKSTAYTTLVRFISSIEYASVISLQHKKTDFTKLRDWYETTFTTENQEPLHICFSKYKWDPHEERRVKTRTVFICTCMYKIIHSLVKNSTEYLLCTILPSDRWTLVQNPQYTRYTRADVDRFLFFLSTI